MPRIRSFTKSPVCKLLTVFEIAQASMLCVAICSGLPVKNWTDWVSEGLQLHHAGSYSAAVSAFRHALALAESPRISSRELIEIRAHLAVSYIEGGQLAEGAPEYRKVLALIEKDEGRESLDYAVVLSSMPSSPGQGETSDETIAVLRRALVAHRQDGSKDELLSLQSNLAQMLLESRHDTEAEQVLLQLRAELLKNNVSGEILAASLTELGVLRFNQKRYSEAAGFYLQSLELLESTNGSEDPRLIPSMNNLATAYVKAGRPQEAQNLYDHAISLCSKTHGENALMYSILLQNDGVVLRKLGRRRQANAIGEKGRQIERVFRRQNAEDSTVSIAALRANSK